MTTFPPAAPVHEPPSDPLDGCRPARLPARLAAWVVDLVLASVLMVLALSVLEPGADDDVSALLVRIGWWAGLLVVAGAGVVLVTSTTPGGLVLGHRSVEAASGRLAGPRAVAKYAVEALLGLLTAGLGAITLVATAQAPWNRHWVDRLTGLAVIDIRRGRHPAREAAASPPSGQERRVGVQPVLLPDEQSLIVEGPNWGPPPPVGGDQRRPDTVPAPIRPHSRTPVAMTPWQHTTRREPGHPILLLDTGEEHEIPNVVVIGRNPAGLPGFEKAVLVRIEDPGRSISKTHLAIGEAGHGVWVQDLGSTNGVHVIDLGGTSRRVVPGERVPAAPGALVRFGDRELQILRR